MSDWLIKRWRGTVSYRDAWAAMKCFTAGRGSETRDELWLLSHEPVYTQGLAGRAEHVLNPKDIPIVQSDRGGQITYHGPGQLMLYTLFDIERLGLSTRDFVRRLEQVVINLLAEYEIAASGSVDAPGVYIEKAKVCSIGLRIKKGRGYHGCSLNVDGDLTPFNGIDPCGYESLKMTCIADHAPVNLDDVIQKAVKHFACLFGFNSLSVLDQGAW